MIHLGKNDLSLHPWKKLQRKKNKDIEEEEKPVFVPKKERKMDITLRMQNEKPNQDSSEDDHAQSFKNLATINIVDPLELIDKKEIEDIKSEYMEKKAARRRKQRTNEKTKISFEWDEKDDTTDKTSIINTISSSANASKKPTPKKTKEEDERNWREKKIHEMTDRDWRIFREDFDIVVKGGKVPNPIRSWEETTLLPLEILNALTDLKFSEPTPVQMQCIPIAMAGLDLVGLAQTGSGKTAAYIIPLLCQIAKYPRLDDVRSKDGPYGLILVPARELAEQIEKEANKFARQFDFRVRAIIGGVSIEKQSRLMREGCEILVATPGRLIDCLNNSIIVLNQCHHVVLDEADKMIEMNFEKDVNTILDTIPPNISRQTLLFSATMPPQVENIATKYLKRRVTVAIGEVGQAVERIEQEVVWAKSDHSKRNLLVEILSEAEPPIIIFCNLKKEVDALASFIANVGFKVTTLHGSKTQDQRNKSLEAFKSGKFDIMIATDVLGRGIHISGVTLVINYSLPKTIDTYTHRIGRTGRAGRTGKAISFLTNEDTEIMYPLKKMLEDTKNMVPDELAKHPLAAQKPEKKKGGDQQRGGASSSAGEDVYMQQQDEDQVMQE
ncbi:hypothetical protein FDP41_003082 [Naegleria fowleri]|uniref:Probable eukaryotic initiation factor 4A n=1 Tax=Naegleria fowleri TaxID=5763 RepID=A0A6A5BVH8_NAEFO|nr:uncharacterized protein FDP41_003082 [Naegleria fowleri]KAF0977760.1 hypothetical protein FDP41_003082 [Naegleria fowleri]